MAGMQEHAQAVQRGAPSCACWSTLGMAGTKLPASWHSVWCVGA